MKKYRENDLAEYASTSVTTTAEGTAIHYTTLKLKPTRYTWVCCCV